MTTYTGGQSVGTTQDESPEAVAMRADHAYRGFPSSGPMRKK